jgi:hypothetical protein
MVRGTSPHDIRGDPMSPRGIKSNGDTATKVFSIRVPGLIVRMLEHTAAAAGEDRNTWIVTAIRERLARLGDPIEALRSERAELAARLVEVEEALRRALKAAERKA